MHKELRDIMVDSTNIDVPDSLKVLNNPNATHDQRRFSGFTIPQDQLDGTGPSYYNVKPGIDSSEQPAYYLKTDGLSGDVGVYSVIDTVVPPADPIPKVQSSKNGLYTMSSEFTKLSDFPRL